MRLGATSIILIMAVLGAAGGGYLQWRHRHAAEPAHRVVRVGEPLPALELKDLDDQHHVLQSTRGQPMLLNFWASWCLPCLDELPRLTQVVRTGKIQVIGIAMDDPVQVRAFLAEHPLDFPVWLGRLKPPATSLYFGDSGGVLPYSVLVGADGRLLATHAGPLSPAELAQWLQRAKAAP